MKLKPWMQEALLTFRIPPLDSSSINSISSSNSTFCSIPQSMQMQHLTSANWYICNYTAHRHKSYCRFRRDQLRSERSINDRKNEANPLKFSVQENSASGLCLTSYPTGFQIDRAAVFKKPSEFSWGTCCVRYDSAVASLSPPSGWFLFSSDDWQDSLKSPNS